MLQETVAQITALIQKENSYVVTAKSFRKLVLDQLSIAKEGVVTEPLARNTGPCVGLAAVMLEAKHPWGIMVVFPADHVIKETERFLNILKKAIGVDSAGTHLIILGVVTDCPAAAYGYVRRGRLLYADGDVAAYQVQRFTEKLDEPDSWSVFRRREPLLEQRDFHLADGYSLGGD